MSKTVICFLVSTIISFSTTACECNCLEFFHVQLSSASGVFVSLLFVYHTKESAAAIDSNDKLKLIIQRATAYID